MISFSFTTGNASRFRDFQKCQSLNKEGYKQATGPDRPSKHLVPSHGTSRGQQPPRRGFRLGKERPSRIRKAAMLLKPSPTHRLGFPSPLSHVFSRGLAFSGPKEVAKETAFEEKVGLAKTDRRVRSFRPLFSSHNIIIQICQTRSAMNKAGNG